MAEVLVQVEESIKQTTQTQLECVGLMREEVEAQTVNNIKEKIVQALTKVVELQEQFHTITKEIEETQRN